MVAQSLKLNPFKRPEGAGYCAPSRSRRTQRTARNVILLKGRASDTRRELDLRVLANLESGLKWLAGCGDETNILNPGFLAELHRRMFGEVWSRAGEMRDKERDDGVSPGVLAGQLEAALEHAKFWAENDVYPALEAAARFHHRLMQLCAFDIGNNCHARIATELYLREYFGFPPWNWSSGADLKLSDARRDQYAAALKAADDGRIDELMAFLREEAPAD